MLKGEHTSFSNYYDLYLQCCWFQTSLSQELKKLKSVYKLNVNKCSCCILGFRDTKRKAY